MKRTSSSTGRAAAFSRSSIVSREGFCPIRQAQGRLQSSPTLGPDATALGQVFWYTLEGRDPDTGEPLGGFDLDELRSVQDFLALFGIATDDGVLVATFLRDSFRQNAPQTTDEIRAAVIEGGQRRVRPAMMTTATTILALLPVLTSTGRGADIMVPMAIPSFGGMALQVLTMFTVWRGRLPAGRSRPPERVGVGE